MTLAIVLDPNEYGKTWRVRHIYGSITLVNNTAFLHTTYVPKHKLWIPLIIGDQNGDDVARYIYQDIHDDEGRLVVRLQANQVVANGWSYYPNNDDLTFGVSNIGIGNPLILPPRWSFAFNLAAGGVSAGGESLYTYYVVEVDVNE